MPTSKPYVMKAIDLCPKKPDPGTLIVDGTVISVEIKVTTKKNPIPEVTLKRLADTVAKQQIDEYSKIIQEEVLKLEAKIKKLDAAGQVTESKQMIADTQLSVRNAAKGLQGAVDVAVAKQLKIDAKNDKDLLEAQVVVVLKASLIVIKAGVNIAKLAVSHGADVTSYVALARNVLDMVKLITAALASEYKVREEFRVAIVKYQQAARTTPASAKPKLDAKLDEIRRNHKNKVTGLRQDLEKLSLKADELFKKAKTAKTFKNGIALGAKSMTLRQTVTVQLKDYLEIEQVAQHLADKAKELGVAPDDRSVIERVTLADVKKYASEMKDIVEDIIKLAA